MATNYVKVSPYVAAKMGLQDSRGTFPDGNYMLWEKDLRDADRDWAFHPAETLAAIGGVLLNPWEAKSEMRKAAGECVALPEPTDAQWRQPQSESESGSEDGSAHSGSEAPETEQAQDGGETAGETDPDNSDNSQLTTDNSDEGKEESL